VPIRIAALPMYDFPELRDAQLEQLARQWRYPELL
jgi:hypothetical protein